MKIHPPKALLLGAVCLSLLGAGVFYLRGNKGFPYAAPAGDVEIKLKGNGSTAQGEVYEITAGDVHGEATLVSAPTSNIAQGIVNSHIVGVTSTFRNSRAPYAGQITAVINCDTKKFVKEQPMPFLGQRAEMVLAVANSRRIFGICAINEVKFATGTWAGYDADRKQVLTVKLFKPVDDPGAIEDSQKSIVQVFQKVINQQGGIQE